MGNNRTTFLIGAGTPLDLDLPQGVIKASTSNITNDVRRPYTNYLTQGNTITIVDDIYNQLMSTYPPDCSNPYISETPTPYIHFEHLFHVLEMLDAYSWVWSKNSKNPNLYPVFAPFIRPNIEFDADTLHSVMDQFILRIMDIVNGYDSNIMKEQANEWYWEFYQRFADGGLDVNEILDKYIEQQKRDSDTHDEIVYRSAEGYNLQTAQEETTSKEDVLVIDQNLKGLEFKLAKCCNPIYGDDVFGFVTVSGGIKIHRSDCPNANQMRERFGYRIVKARWAGKSEGTQYPITLRVVGHDDIGIVTNITSIISKENGITLRSIGIDSNDGLFSGTLTVMVGDTGRLEALIKKLRTVKGVKQVSRN